MQTPQHPLRNILLPLLILLPMLGSMSGCIYVPWFEHRIDSGPNVRALAGAANTDRLIRPFHVTRQQVIKVLGEAPFYSADGSALGYVARTNYSAWVWPLWLTIEPADSKSYAVKLIFNDKGVLTRFEWASSEDSYPPMSYLLGGGVPMNLDFRDSVAVKKLNVSKPFLKARNPQYVWNLNGVPVTPPSTYPSTLPAAE